MVAIGGGFKAKSDSLSGTMGVTRDCGGSKTLLPKLFECALASFIIVINLPEASTHWYIRPLSEYPQYHQSSILRNNRVKKR